MRLQHGDVVSNRHSVIWLGGVVDVQRPTDPHIVDVVLAAYRKYGEKRRTSGTRQMKRAGRNTHRAAKEFRIVGAPSGIGNQDRDDAVRRQPGPQDTESRAG